VSYRCSICGVKVGRNKPRLTHIVPKKGSSQTARELPVCGGCHVMLQELPLESIRDPYYLRPRSGVATVFVSQEHEPAEPPSDVGRPVSTTTL